MKYVFILIFSFSLISCVPPDLRFANETNDEITGVKTAYHGYLLTYTDNPFYSSSVLKIYQQKTNNHVRYFLKFEIYENNILDLEKKNNLLIVCDSIQKSFSPYDVYLDYNYEKKLVEVAEYNCSLEDIITFSKSQKLIFRIYGKRKYIDYKLREPKIISQFIKQYSE